MEIRPEWISAFADAVVAGSAFLAFLQFKREGLWKRKERIAQFFNGFQNTPGARNAVLMLENKEREIPLWDASDPKDRYRVVTWRDVEIALLPPSSGLVRTEPTYSAIRDSFLDLLHRFAGLERLVQERLVSESDINDALRRWFYIIGDKDKDEPHIRNLRLFIKENNLKTSKEVFCRFGIDIDRVYAKDLKSLRDSLPRKLHSDA